MRTFRLLPAFAAVLLFLFHAGIAQGQSTGAGPISGRVVPAVVLSPAAEALSVNTTSDVSATVFSVGRDRVVVRVSGSSQSAVARVSVRLLMRTNTRYRLSASLVSPQTSPSIAGSIRSVNPTGPAVVPSAKHGLVDLKSATVLSANPLTLVDGPRISTGAPSSPRNALDVEVMLDIAQGPAAAWSTDVLFTIEAVI
ncbi:MAG TPA: hypothetical protein VJH03_05535 [Blastocatellia bacterium]|nr:hypothetical protein [Blastocatellia bacterium]